MPKSQIIKIYKMTLVRSLKLKINFDDAAIAVGY
jgi:hypothetical protein